MPRQLASRVSLLVLTLLLAPLPAEQPAVPRLEFESTEWDFGTLLEGKVVEHLYRFTNTGAADLLLREARAECGCTAVKITTEAVPPGGRGEVLVRFDSMSRQGSQAKRVHIFSNDPHQPEMILVVKGTVTPLPAPRIMAAPNRVDMGLIQPGESGRGEVVIRNAGVRDLVLEPPVGAPPELRVLGLQSSLVPPGGQTTLELELQPTQSTIRGYFQRTVRVISNDPRRPQTYVQVLAYVAPMRQGQLTSLQGGLELGIVDQPGTRLGLIPVVNTGLAPVAIARIKVTGANLEVSTGTTTLAPGELAVVELRSRTRLVKGTMREQVLIYPEEGNPTSVIVSGYVPEDVWGRPAVEEEQGGLAPEGSPVTELSIIFHGDRHGRIAPVVCSSTGAGGLARECSAVHTQRETGRTSLLVNLGSLFGAEAPGGARRSILMLHALTEIGYQVTGVDLDDLIHGGSFLDQAADRFPFHIVSANLRARPGRPEIATPYALLPAGNRVVCVTSVAAPELPADLDSRARQTLETQVLVEPPGAALQGVLQEVGDRADLVLLLSSVGLAESERLAREFPELDVIIVGHGDQVLESPRRVGGALLVTGDPTGESLGVLSVRVTAGGLELLGLEQIHLTPEVPEDREVAEMVRAYRQFFLREQPGSPPPGDGPTFVGPAGCRLCHPESHDRWVESSHATAYNPLQSNTLQAQGDPECLPCHTTGYGQPGGFLDPRTAGHLLQVSCEACHGPASGHLQHPGEPFGRETARQCERCHTPERGGSFDPEAAWERIRH